MATNTSTAKSSISNRGCALVAGWALLVGATFFLGAVLSGEVRLALFGAKADGVVTKVEERSRSSRVSYVLTVQFTRPGGEDTEFKTTGTFDHELKAGDAVKVIYLPTHPTKAEIYSARQLWLPIATGFTVSAVTFALGALFLKIANRSRPPPPKGDSLVEIV